jgi:hypothetical protein
MKLADLRRVAIKTGVRFRFSLSNGLECVLNEHGIAEIPALKAVPDFNLEDELARVGQFTLEPAAAVEKNKNRPQVFTREQLAAVVGLKTTETAHDEHED